MRGIMPATGLLTREVKQYLLLNTEQVKTILEGYISRIFGLTLLELIEPALILSVVIGGTALYFAWKQQQFQKKITSVNISMEMLKRFREDDFRTTVRFLKTGKTSDDKWDKDTELLKIMNHFEEMGLFEKEGMLDMDHIKQLHGHVLNLIKNNEHSKMLFNEWRIKDPDFYFIHLAKLLEKS